MKHAANAAATKSAPRQSAVVNVPRFQNVMFRACGSRAMYERKPVPALHIALSAIPDNKSVKTSVLPKVVDSLYTTMVAANEQAKAITGTPAAANGDAKLSAELPNTNTIAAPNAAPAEVPVRPG